MKEETQQRQELGYLLPQDEAIAFGSLLHQCNWYEDQEGAVSFSGSFTAEKDPFSLMGRLSALSPQTPLNLPFELPASVVQSAFLGKISYDLGSFKFFIPRDIEALSEIMLAEFFTRLEEKFGTGVDLKKLGLEAALFNCFLENRLAVVFYDFTGERRTFNFGKAEKSFGSIGERAVSQLLENNGLRVDGKKPIQPLKMTRRIISL